MTAAPLNGDLYEWLAWLEGLDPNKITPGLQRVREVGQRLDVLTTAQTVISIAGTNGKGSTAALLEQTLLNAGYSVAVYSSPHLLRYNERLRMNGHDIDDASLCAAFTTVAEQQQNTALSYFEFGTLAVLWLIKKTQVDVAILEVGLGGRLDAVNVIDAHCALITSIGLDHQDWLGEDRETIGREKAGTMRPGIPAICNDPAAPDSIRLHADSITADLIQLGVDYGYTTSDTTWAWNGLGKIFDNLPRPAISGDIYVHNAAGALAALVSIQAQRSWQKEDFSKALLQWSVPGRAQQLKVNQREVWLDVAHNAEAAAALADTLRKRPPKGRSIAVFAALKAKPIAEIMDAMSPVVDEWQLAGLAHIPRGLAAEELVEFARLSGLQWQSQDSVETAWKQAQAQSAPDDRIIVLGSFHTVQAVLEDINT